MVELSAGPTFHDGGEDAFAGGMHAGFAVRHAVGPHLLAGLTLEQHELRFDPREYPRWVPFTPDSYPGDQRIVTLGLEARWRTGTARDRVRGFGSLGAGVAWPDQLEAVSVRTRVDRFTGTVLRHEDIFQDVGDPTAMGTIGGGVECALGELRVTAGARLRSDAGSDLTFNDLFLAAGTRVGGVEESGPDDGSEETAPLPHRSHWMAWGGPAMHMASEDLYQKGHAWGVTMRIPFHARGAAAAGLEHARFDFDSDHWVSPDPERSAAVLSADPRTFTIVTLDGVIYTASSTRALRPYGAAGLGFGRTGSASVTYILDDPPDPGTPETSRVLLFEPDSYGVLSAAAGVEWKVGPLRTFLQARYRRSVGGDIEVRDAAVGIGY